MSFTAQSSHNRKTTEDGFVLVALIVAIFLILLALSVAAPRVAEQLKRDRELETEHRAGEYDRAIQLYYRQFHQYPPSLEALEKTNNRRFLRQRYADPLTGKVDWRLIHMGENKTTVKGFFGQDLSGIAPGLGAATSNGSNANLGSASGSASTFGGGFSSSTSPSATQTANGAFGATGTGTSGASPGSASGAGGGSSIGSGVSSQSATGAQSPGGVIMGVGVPKAGNAILSVNEQGQYQDWEFLYDPRVETLKAQVSIFGGGIATGGASNSLGSASSMTGSGSATSPGSTAPATVPPSATTPQ